MSKVFAVLGRPGTEPALFARLLGLQLRAAEVFSVRAAAAAEMEHRTHLGNQIAQLAAPDLKGQLLPSAIVAPLVQTRLPRASVSGGALVLAGFPRTADQLRMLQHAGFGTPHSVLHLNLTRADAEHRVADRRVCEACGEPMYTPPGNTTGAIHAHLVDADCEAHAPRRDPHDDPSVLRRRLDAYDAHTSPLIEQMRARGVVHDIDVDNDAEATWARMLAACGLLPDGK